jgi:HAMP domain
VRNGVPRTSRAAPPIAGAYPETSALGGVVLPWIVTLTFFLVLAGLTAVTVGRGHDGAVAEAVLLSQKQVAADLAYEVRISLSRELTDLGNAGRAVSENASAGSATPTAILGLVGAAHPEWRGLALLDSHSGKLLATRGEPVPVAALGQEPIDQPTATMTHDPAGRSAVILAAPMSIDDQDHSVLAAATRPRLPRSFDSAVTLVDESGEPVVASGSADVEGSLAQAVARAVRDATHGSGSVAATVLSARRHVIGYARVAGEGLNDLPLYAISIRPVLSGPPTHPGRGFGLAAGVALAYLALAAFAGHAHALIGPVRRIEREAAWLAKGDASVTIGKPRPAEPGRLAVALEAIRGELIGRPVRDQGRSPLAHAFTARGTLIVTALLIVAWAIAVPVLSRSMRPERVPAEVIDDQRGRITVLADTLARGINDATASLERLARAVRASVSHDDLRRLLAGAKNADERFRSIYVVEPDGKVAARAGTKPRRSSGPLPSVAGVSQANISGPVPIVVAYAPAADGLVIAGELDPRYLDDRLDRPGLGTVWIVDPGRRIISSDDGFHAFGRLTDSAVERAVDRALTGVHTSRVYRDHGPATIVAAAQLRPVGPAGMLGWTVVSKMPADQLPLPVYVVRRHATVVGLLAIAGLWLCYGWLYLVGVRPLRILVQDAERIAWPGDRRMVIYPRVHNEIGSIARNLEVLRLRLLGIRSGALKPPLTGRDARLPETQLIAKIQVPRPAALGSGRRSGFGSGS